MNLSTNHFVERSCCFVCRLKLTIPTKSLIACAVMSSMNFEWFHQSNQKNASQPVSSFGFSCVISVRFLISFLSALSNFSETKFQCSSICFIFLRLFTEAIQFFVSETKFSYFSWQLLQRFSRNIGKFLVSLHTLRFFFQ